jgi:hypothetical protein
MDKQECTVYKNVTVPLVSACFCFLLGHNIKYSDILSDLLDTLAAMHGND